uniref:Uncharacterized protein n=1 Tax=Aegilops tauschii subsp. strangulata TaxID=200361 RepID=A0A453GDY6_AEGTS
LVLTIDLIPIIFVSCFFRIKGFPPNLVSLCNSNCLISLAVSSPASRTLLKTAFLASYIREFSYLIACG